MNGSLHSNLQRAISGVVQNELKPLLNPLSLNNTFGSPWLLLNDVVLSFINLRFFHNFQNSEWDDVDSSYPLITCNENAVLIILSCDFSRGQNVSTEFGLNGIIVSRSYGVVCNLTSCTFVDLALERTTLFHDEGNTTFNIENCLIKNITSSSMYGSVYSSKKLTLKHDAYFINTTVDKITANSVVCGGVLYFISSLPVGIQHVINCTIKEVNVIPILTSQTDSIVKGGALYYGSTPESLVVSNTSFLFIKKAEKGGAVCLDFGGDLVEKNVFVNNTFRSLEAVYGGGVYTKTNVSIFFFIIFVILYHVFVL
jgi:hypothetical protein